MDHVCSKCQRPKEDTEKDGMAITFWVKASWKGFVGDKSGPGYTGKDDGIYYFVCPECYVRGNQ